MNQTIQPHDRTTGVRTFRSIVRSRRNGESSLRDSLMVVRPSESFGTRSDRGGADEDLMEVLKGIRDRVRELRDLVPQSVHPMVDQIEGAVLQGVELSRQSPLDMADRFDEERDYMTRLARRYPMLSRRELEVCSHIRSGLSNKRIAERMYTSLRNVEQHRYRIRRKLGLGEENLATLMARI